MHDLYTPGCELDQFTSRLARVYVFTKNIQNMFNSCPYIQDSLEATAYPKVCFVNTDIYTLK